MHKPLSLRRNFSWTLAGSVITVGCQWLMLIVMAKLLDIEQVGYYTLALSIISPIMMFSMLQLRTVLVTDVHESFSFGDYFGVRLFTNGLTGLVVLGVIASLFGRYGLVVCGVIFIVFLNKAIESTADISFAVLQKQERLDKAAISMVLKNVFAVVALSVVLWATGSILMGAISIGFCWLAVLLFYDRPNVELFEKWKPHWRWKAVGIILLVGLPLGVTRGFIALNDSIPRYFIEGYLGTSSQAVFAAMAYTVTAAGRCIESLGYSAAARLARYYAINRKAYMKLLLKMLCVSIGLGLLTIFVGVVGGRQILAFVYKAEYAQQPDVFVWLLIVAAGKMVASILNHGMNAARYFKAQVPLNIISLLVAAMGCVWLVPQYGLKGAAWAMLCAITAKIMGSLFVIRLALKQKNDIAESDNNISLDT